MDIKLCSKCKEFKPFAAFYKDKRTSTGLYAACKECVKAERAEWSDDKKVAQAEYLRDYSLKNKYGITAKQWDDLFIFQGEKCKTCGSKDPNTSSGWHTDHDHKTGKIRGILCHHCNRALGWYEAGWVPPGLTETFERYLRG